MKRRILLAYPLVFLMIGLAFFFIAEHEFQRRIDRDNAEMRQDLHEAGVPRAEIAALMSAHTKLQANASSYTQITSFLNLVLSVMMAIPLYTRLRSDIGPSATSSPPMK